MLRPLSTATTEPVSLAEAKLHLREDSNARDTLITAAITAAREVVERQTGYALAEVEYEWTPEGDRREPLPLYPAEVTSAVDAYPILLTAQPGAVVPAALKAAILLVVDDQLTNTSASTEQSLVESQAFQRLIFPYRRVLP